MNEFLEMVLTHIMVSLASLIGAGLIGVSMGLLVAVYKKGEKIIIGFFQILRIVPSLALLILLIPIMGTGLLPTMTALIILGIPPILMNTVTGIEDVPDFYIETAKGQGMNEKQIMMRVKLQMAMPVMLAGVKTAMIEIIASATLAAKIGGGGLGELIFTGLGLNRMDLVLIGGLSVAALSLTANFIAGIIDRCILKYKYVR